MDALEETLNNLAINDLGYYESDSENVNDAKGNPTSDPKLASHTSDRRKKLQTLETDICNKKY